MVSVSTTAKVGSRRPDRLSVVVFFLGLLKILLGKPGTLHSPGHILSLGPGRPAGPKRRFSHFEDWSRTTAGWGCGCVPTDPAGRVCLSYQARVGPSHHAHVGPALNPFALPLFTHYFTQVPYVSVRGRGAGWLIWCLHSHPTGSYCAESPDLLYRTGFYIKLT